MPMNALKAKRCSLLMTRYKQNKDVELRNHIYKLSRTGIIKCLKSASRSHFTEVELLSMSWDVFMLCIERFSPEEDYVELLINASHTVMNKVYFCKVTSTCGF